jgi:hypothetical protein
VKRKDLSKLLIVLTDGEIAWDDACDDFDWSKTTALPERLRGAFDHEPLYLDFRQLAGGRLSLDNEQFLDHIATIAAPLHGTSKDAIFGEHIRQHRKTMRIAWSAVAALVALMFVAIGSTVSAVRASLQERAARLEAERQTRVARGQQLAAQAKTADVEGYHQRSLLLAAEALRVSEQAAEPRVAAAEEAIRIALSRIGGYGLNARWRDRRFPIALSPDNRWLVIGGKDRTAQLWDLEATPLGTGATILHDDAEVVSAAFSPDSRWLVTGGWRPFANGSNPRDLTLKFSDSLKEVRDRRPWLAIGGISPPVPSGRAISAHTVG